MGGSRKQSTAYDNKQSYLYHHIVTFVKVGPELRCVQKCKNSGDNILLVSTWTTKLTSKHDRSQTRLNTGEQIDAPVDFLVVNEHMLTVKWRTFTKINAEELVQGTNIKSSDRGGTETAAGPTVVARIVNRHAPQPKPRTQLNQTRN